MLNGGVYCASWVPFTDTGEVLWEAYEQNLRFVLKHEITGLMVLGSTGSFPFFDLHQKMQIVSRTVELCLEHPKKPAVIVNLSDLSFARALALGEKSRELGVTAVSLLPPWFYPLEPRDIAEFFIQAGERVGLPVLLYNYPEVTGKRLELETIDQVASEIPLAGIKQSGSEFDYHLPLVELGRKFNFPVFSGADTRLPEAHALGVAGAVSGMASAVPDLITSIWQGLQSGGSTEPAQSRIAEFRNLTSGLPFPMSVKAAVEARGLESGAFPNPLSIESRDEYQYTVSSLRGFFQKHSLLS